MVPLLWLALGIVVALVSAAWQVVQATACEVTLAWLPVAGPVEPIGVVWQAVQLAAAVLQTGVVTEPEP